MQDIENPQGGVTSILNVAEEIDLEVSPLEYYKIPLEDGKPILPERMREAIMWIRDHIASGRVLVGCHYGVGRSPSIVMGYLCSMGYGYEDALHLVSPKETKVVPLPRLAETIRKTLVNLEGG